MPYAECSRRSAWRPGLVAACGLLLLVAAGGASAAQAKDLKALMKATGLKHAMQDEGTACLLMRGKAGLHPVVVRSLKGRLAVMCEIVPAKPEDTPTALWRTLAQANAAPRLAHAGLQESVLYAVAGAALEDVDAKLLRAMIIDVAALTDELQPVAKDLLAVE